MFSLSVSRAAATLAATFVGLQLGLFDTATVNAIMLVIVLSLVASSLTATFFGTRIPRPPVETERIGRSVLVQIDLDGGNDVLTGLAARLARVDGGVVRPLYVVAPGGPQPSSTQVQAIDHDIAGLGHRRLARRPPRPFGRAGTRQRRRLVHQLADRHARLRRDRAGARSRRRRTHRRRPTGGRTVRPGRRCSCPRRTPASRGSPCSGRSRWACGWPAPAPTSSWSATTTWTTRCRPPSVRSPSTESHPSNGSAPRRLPPTS